MNVPIAIGQQAPATSSFGPVQDAFAIPPGDWDALVAHASEPNSFLERWFFTASVSHLSPPPDTRLLAVRDEGQLIGMMPVFAAPNYGRLPVRHAQLWCHYHSFYAAPLVRRGFEAFFWARALEMLDGWTMPFFQIAGLDADGPLARALLDARRGAAIVHRTRRAALRSDLSPQDYYEQTVRKKKRKEIARLRTRLCEQGKLDTSWLDEGAAVDDWIERFLALESSGWKGREGAALANDTATASFLREALRDAHRSGRLDMVRIDLDGRTLAILVNFLCPPGSYSFKIAFDEDYARFSPGVLVQIENLAILSRRDIAWMDSCAVEGHPMIESLWGQRRDIVRITVPLRGWRRRGVFAACRALENASAVLRRAA